MTRATKIKGRYLASRKQLAQHAMRVGIRQAGRDYGVAHSVVQYHVRKSNDPTFHSQPWGGQSSSALGENRHLFLDCLWAILKEDNTLIVAEMVERIYRRTHLMVKPAMVYRQLHAWKFSSKVSFAVQRAKYTQYNLAYYVAYVTWFASLPTWRNVKVMDEVHFDSRRLQARKMTWSLKGDKNARTNVVLAKSGISENYSGSVIVGVDESQDPIFLQLRKDSNDQFDWTNFIFDAVEQNYLRPGDILILDNARVHNGAETVNDVLEVLDERNVEIRFLPTYSPELSPIELVFQIVKRHMRINRTEDKLIDAIEAGFKTVSHNFVKSCYLKVLQNYAVHPMNLPPQFEYLNEANVNNL